MGACLFWKKTILFFSSILNMVNIEVMEFLKYQLDDVKSG